MTIQTKTYPIQKCQDLSASVSVVLNLTWNGDLQSATISGTLKVGYIGIGDVKGAVKINGNEIGTFDMQEISVGVAQGNFSFDAKNYLAPGTNTIDVWAWVQWGAVGFYYACVNDGSLVITADDITIIPPTTYTDYIRIAIIGGLIVATIGVIGYTAGKIAPRRHRD